MNEKLSRKSFEELQAYFPEITREVTEIINRRLAGKRLLKRREVRHGEQRAPRGRRYHSKAGPHDQRCQRRQQERAMSHDSPRVAGPSASH